MKKDLEKACVNSRSWEKTAEAREIRRQVIKGWKRIHNVATTLQLQGRRKIHVDFTFLSRAMCPLKEIWITIYRYV